MMKLFPKCTFLIIFISLPTLILAEDNSSGLARALNTKDYFPHYLDNAISQAKQDKCDRAIEEIEKIDITDFERQYPEKIFLLEGLCYQALKDHNAAIKSFKQSLKYRDGAADTLYFLAESQLAVNLPLEAAKSLEEALWFARSTLVPLEEIFVNAARVYRTGGDIERAASTLVDAIAKNGQNVNARLELADVRLAQSKKDEAIAQLREALRTDPARSDSKLLLAKALLFNSTRTVNFADIREAKQLSSELEESSKNNEQLRPLVLPVYIKSLLEMGEIDNAEKFMKEALRKNSTDPELLKLKNQVAMEREAWQQKKAAEEKPRG